MPRSWRSLPPALDVATNREILAYLAREQPSAHSDLTEELVSATSAISGIDYYCPDPHNYSAMVAFVPSGRVIGVAVGMSHVLVPLAAQALADALVDGAEPAPEVGSQWAQLRVFGSAPSLEHERQRLARWLGAAAYSQG